MLKMFSPGCHTEFVEVFCKEEGRVFILLLRVKPM